MTQMSFNRDWINKLWYINTVKYYHAEWKKPDYILYDKYSRKCKLIFSGRKQIDGCLGEEVRSEELKKDMEKKNQEGHGETFETNRDVHYLNVVALWVYTYVKMHIVHF